MNSTFLKVRNYMSLRSSQRKALEIRVYRINHMIEEIKELKSDLANLETKIKILINSNLMITRVRMTLIKMKMMESGSMIKSSKLMKEVNMVEEVEEEEETIEMVEENLEPGEE